MAKYYKGEIMSIKANILRDAHGDIIVQMEGDLGYEHSHGLRSEISDLVSKNPQSQVTIDLGGLDFVGSSGICHFLETIHIINQDIDFKKIKLSNVGTDFRKMVRLFDKYDAIFESFEMDSDETSEMSTRFAARSRTFEN
jgi:anti-sigma B factor antagonist